MNKLIGVLSVIATFVIILVIITWNHNDRINNQSNMMNETDSKTNSEQDSNNGNVPQQNSSSDIEDVSQIKIQPKEGQPIKEFELVAQENNQELKQGIEKTVWTYGGTVPGKEIRVTEGDFVRVRLKNTLGEPITIHWHGYPLKSEMDGIPGYTQDAVLPGQTFTYEFSADYTGTYWYHSHQESSKQVDKGLYGALIVEPKVKDDIDKEYTLILDEWMEDDNEEMDMSSDSNSMNEGMDMSSDSNGMNMENADSSNQMPGMSEADQTTNNSSSDPEMEEEQMMKELYNIYTINGKSGDLIESLNINQGDTVRLRLINAGYRSHGIHIPGQDMKVVSTDGQDINGAGEFRDQVILISPGERYDIEFTVGVEESFYIDFHDDNLYNDQIKIPVIVNNVTNFMNEDVSKQPEYFDFFNYGEFNEGKFSLDQTFDVEQDIVLDTKVTDGSLNYTINGETYSSLLPITVKEGDFVKLTYINNSLVDHPMHLHGHFFQVLSKNDKSLTGATIMKDTLLIKPGEKYVIAFEADNPGNWVQHCHELHHAAGGMMQKVIYSDYVSIYKPDPENPINKPE